MDEDPKSARETRRMARGMTAEVKSSRIPPGEWWRKRWDQDAEEVRDRIVKDVSEKHTHLYLALECEGLHRTVWKRWKEYAKDGEYAEEFAAWCNPILRAHASLKRREWNEIDGADKTFQSARYRLQSMDPDFILPSKNEHGGPPGDDGKPTPLTIEHVALPPRVLIEEDG